MTVEITRLKIRKNKLRETNMDSGFYQFCILLFPFILGFLACLPYISKEKEEAKKEALQAVKNLEAQNTALQKVLADERKNAQSERERLLQMVKDAQIRQKNEKAEEIRQEAEKSKEVERAIRHFIKETKQSHPELAMQISDIQYNWDMRVYNRLISKQRPAVKAADEVKQIAGEKRKLLAENKQLQYQLDFLERLFPWIEEFKEVPIDEAVSYATGSYNSNVDAVRDWLSPEEYARLENTEKYQLALDRWKNRKNKTDWDVGIEYERYIGYRLECENYKVYYSGAMLGVNDMGRDLIAKKKESTLVIQCKRWSKEKTIHEKHIFQLYGSLAVLAIENPNETYKGVFITTATLSETARRCAEYCNITFVENCPIGDYPLIKCNASKKGELIYHLPFDQQYDKVVISKNTKSCYAWTTKEAEDKGFRRAYRWHPQGT